VNKSIKNLPALRNALLAINENDLTVQQDMLETFLTAANCDGSAV